MTMITTDDVIIVDSTTLYCSACGDTIAVEPEPDGELMALSAKEAEEIAAGHVKDKHRG
jgi:adenosine/AMP kinase